ncbi:DUF2341 domain-containing protein [Candidatus Babeliales bacterium]|nr:DUF2341 domain-containing protein [Candidatus Babeliales bacterium]
MGNLPDWPYWKDISITGQAGAGTDYQVELEIGDSAGGDFHLEGHCTNFPQDIRITDDDGTTLLDHFIEDLTADPIKVRVEVKDDLGSNRDIRVYYGKSGETTASDIATTFIIGDHFPGSSIDTSKWDILGTDYSSVTNSKLTLNYGATNAPYNNLNSKTTFGIGHAVEFYINPGAVGGSGGAKFWGVGNGASPAWYTNADGWYARNGGWVLLNNAAEAGTTNVDASTYKKYRIQKESVDVMRFFKDDVEMTNSPLNPTFEGSSSVSFYAGISMEIEWLFVRKFNSPEPAFSSAGAEQTPGVPILTRLTTKGETIITLTIDERGNRVISNIITEYGDTVFSESRLYSDMLTVGDVRLSSISKIIANGVGVLDTISNTIVVTKVLDEIANISDVINNSMSKLLSDGVTIADTINVLRHRIFTEVISIADTLGSFSITKVVLNSFTGLVDSVTRGNVKTPILETVTVNDVIEKGIIRRSFNEAMSIADTLIVTPIKSCMEVIGVTDILGAFRIMKVVSNIVSIIDSRVSSINKTPIEEEVSTNDSISKTPIKVTPESITIADTISNVRRFLYEKRSKVTSKLLQSKVVNKLLRSKVKGIKNSEAEQYED